MAHEYLHQWNVRRLRPQALVPYVCSSPVITSDLWFAEGITSYLDLISAPSGAPGQGRGPAREIWAKNSLFYSLTPGRQQRSLSLSSQEASVKLYRRHANASDAQVSYYLKGAVVALCLDLHLYDGMSSH